jgi:membrane peptidoglycan carboxypeptidase
VLVFRTLQRVVGSVWRVVRAFFKTITVMVVALTVLPGSMALAGVSLALFTPVPVTIPERRELPVILPTTVYDSLNNEIAVFKEFDSNIPVEKEDLPTFLKQALIATEDRRFMTHKGVDLKGIARAVNNEFEGEGGEQGASTITMQLVKQRYSGDEQADLRDESLTPTERAAGKFRQAVIANRIDRERSKEDILFDYLTAVYLGQGAYGVGAASQTYFRKSVSALTLSESATLVGIIPAPSRYEPREHRDASEVKRKLVLGKLLSEGYISQIEHDEAVRQELWVDPADGSVPPIGQPVTKVYQRPKTPVKYPYFVDYVRRYLIAKYGEERVYRGGLAVYTTIIPEMQAKAEEAAAWLLKGTPEKLETSIVSVEPSTGFVRALVGGRDFDAPGGQVNLALGLCPELETLRKRLGKDPDLAPECLTSGNIDGGGTGRSPGSSIKPIVLAAGFARGVTPETTYAGNTYQPTGGGPPIRNYESASYGKVSMRLATVKSVNTAYARLGIDIGIRNVAKMAQDLGITGAWYDKKVHGASYSIGGFDVSPLEMASAYSVFANRGLRMPQTPVIRVVDANGQALEDNSTRRGKRVLTEVVADNVADVMRGVVGPGGTAPKAALKGRPVAGKTGTSQNNGNAWFVGFTPNLSTAVWIGYKDSLKPVRGIKGIRGGVTGGSLPAMTFQRYMSAALETEPVLQFAEPLPIRKEAAVSRKEQLRRQARGGIDPGARRKPIQIPSRRQVETAGNPPVADEETGQFGTRLEPVTTFPAPVSVVELPTTLLPPPEPVPVPQPVPSAPVEPPPVQAPPDPVPPVEAAPAQVAGPTP